MFGRTKQNERPAAVTHDPRDGGKGHPTPKRKDAEAAARARAKATLDSKAARKVLRDRRAEETRKMREALKTGDESHLPTRDRGPVKRFVRTYVDSRFCVAEILLPALLVIMALSYSGNPSARELGFSLQSVVVILTIVDTAWFIFRLRRQLHEKMPDESLRGVNTYALTRAIQMRFMRLPKPLVGIGGRPRKRKR